jgi:hypothetical protein
MLPPPSTPNWIATWRREPTWRGERPPHCGIPQETAPPQRRAFNARFAPLSCVLDILPALKDGDSLSRRSLSRTEEDIASRVDITIMRDATLSTYPASYSEVCDTLRPRLACARRTDSGRERFIHFLVPSSVRNLDKTLKLAETSTFSPPMFKDPASSARRTERATGRPRAMLLPRVAKYRCRCIAKTGSSRNPHPQERHFLPGSSAGVSVPENR